jgi:hypothetical protein
MGFRATLRNAHTVKVQRNCGSDFSCAYLTATCLDLDPHAGLPIEGANGNRRPCAEITTGSYRGAIMVRWDERPH